MKCTKWFIQHTSLKQSELMKEVHALQENNFNWESYGIIKTLSNYEISGIYEDIKEQPIIRCSIAMLKLLTENNYNHKNSKIIDSLKNGISYNYQNFDQIFYCKNIDLPFLNKDSNTIKIQNEEDMSLSFSKDLFVKPTNDQKCFVAGIIPKGQSFKDFIQEKSIPFDKIIGESILFNKVIRIKGEYRFVCIKDQIVGYSKYLEGGNFDSLGAVPEKIVSAAKDFAKVYHPSDIYTMDLCELESGEINIVEYNCWNVSGLYNINRKQLFGSINEYYMKD